MDPLSISASVSGLITLADLIFSRSYKYIKSVKSAGDEIKKLSSEIRTLSGLLHGLRLTLDELETEADWTHFRASQIYACNTTLANIRNEFDKYNPSTNIDHPLKATTQKLKWPFTLAKTKELLLEIEQHKSTINTALVADNVRAVMKVLSCQDNLSHSLNNFKDEARAQWSMETQIRMDEKRKEVLKLFGAIDPLPNHRISLKLRYPTTGLWLTEGLAFKNWLQTRSSKLWLSGIPGAGKTVLAAAVIEETMLQSGPNKAVAYFYCDYKDTQRQNPFRILGSLAAQLARQNERAFKTLQELHLRCCANNSNPVEPEIESLVETICTILACFDDVSIIVDALDECGDNAIGVVESLVSFGSKHNSNARILLLSRDEVGIRQILTKNSYSEVAIAAQSADLRMYVQAEIELRGRKVGRGKLLLKSAELKELIMTTLVDKADGMFRWVSCQLDHLCDLPNDAARRKALATLPPTLNETYERILLRVNPSHQSVQKMVQRTLQWLGCGFTLSISELCEALSIEEGQSKIDKDSQCDEEVILVHCGSLVRRTIDQKGLEFAHFTVKEYLMTLDLSPNAFLAQFTIKPSIVFPILSRLCLTYLLSDDFSHSIPDTIADWNEQQQKYYFRQKAVQLWTLLAEDYWTDSGVLNLAGCMFEKSNINNLLSWARDYAFEIPLGVALRYDSARRNSIFEEKTRSFCDGGLSPLHIAAVHLLVQICQRLVDVGHEINEQSSLGTPLHCALSCVLRFRRKSRYKSQRKAELVQLLVDNGGDLTISCRQFHDREPISCLRRLFDDLNFDEKDAETLIVMLANGAPFENWVVDRLQPFLNYTIGNNNVEKALIQAIQALEADEHIERNILSLKIMLGLDDQNREGLGSAYNLLDFDDLAAKCVQAIQFDRKRNLKQLFNDTRVNLTTSFQALIPSRKRLCWSFDRLNSRQYSFEEVVLNGTALHLASAYGSIAVLEFLLSAGADIEATNNDGLTPLHMAVFGFATSEDRQSRCVLTLLDKGANLDAIDSKGHSVWHIVALYNNLSALKVLQSRAEDNHSALRLPDHNGFIPVFLAAISGSPATFSSLLKITTDIPEMCPDGLTLAHYIAGIGTIADLNLIEKRGFSLNCQSRDGRTPLNYITSRTSVTLIQAFLDAGVDPNVANSDGLIPLQDLLQNWYSYEDEVLELLLHRYAIKDNSREKHPIIHFAAGVVKAANDGLDIHSSGYDSELPFHLSKSYIEKVKKLFDSGVNINSKNSSGQACLQILLKEAALLSDNFLAPTPRNLKVLILFFFEATKDLNTLHTPFLYGSTFVRPISWLFIEGVEAAIKDCLEKGVDINLQNSGPQSVDDESSWSAIDYACFYGCSVEIFDRLLSHYNETSNSKAYGRTPAHTACLIDACSDASLLENLLTHGINIDSEAQNESLRTPLLVAAKNGKADHVRKLLELGVRPHARSKHGWEALHYAAAEGHLLIFQQFPELTIDVNYFVQLYLNDGTFTGCNLLHIAAACGQSAIVKWLVDETGGRNIESLTSEGFSPLYLAALSGDSRSVEILILAGARVDADLGINHARAIHAAAMINDITVAQLLLKHGSTLGEDSKGITPYDTAIMSGHAEIAEWLRSKVPENSIAPAVSDSLANCSPTLSKSTSHALMVSAIASDDVKSLTRLIEGGDSINRVLYNRSTNSPLSYAIYHGKVNAAKHLLENGASLIGSVQKGDYIGWSFAHIACEEPSRLELLLLLLDQGRKFGERFFCTQVSPLHIAVANGNQEALTLLIKHIESLGASFSYHQHKSSQTEDETFYRDRDSFKLIDIQICISDHDQDLLLCKGSYDLEPLTTGDISSGTALHLAAYINNISAAEELLSHGCSVDALDNNSKTPLHIAAQRGHEKFLDVLIRYGANIASQDDDLTTPIMETAWNNKWSTFERLTQLGFDTNHRDSYGFTIMHHASFSPRIFAYLLNLGFDPHMEDNIYPATPLDLACYELDKLPAFSSLLCNSGIDLSRVDHRGMLALFSKNLKWIKIFLRRVGPDNALRIINTDSQVLNGTNLGLPLAMAISRNKPSTVAFLIQSGANLELESGSASTPLVLACSAGRTQIVKILWFAGAKMFGRRRGKSVSAVEAAKAFPKIVAWLLVGRYYEQGKLDYLPNCDLSHELKPRAGPWRAVAHLPLTHVPDPTLSGFDRLVYLTWATKDLLGQVVWVSGLEKAIC